MNRKYHTLTPHSISDEKSKWGKETFAKNCEGLKFHSTYKQTSKPTKDLWVLVEDRKLGLDERQRIAHSRCSVQNIGVHYIDFQMQFPQGFTRRVRRCLHRLQTTLYKSHSEPRETAIMCYKHTCPLLQRKTLSSSSRLFAIQIALKR